MLGVPERKASLCKNIRVMVYYYLMFMSSELFKCGFLARDAEVETYPDMIFYTGCGAQIKI
jgi:hypothetical protein